MNKKTNNQADSDVVLIKKYANRRLYNTKRSSYVTLDDLSQMIRNGEDFVVQDAKSGEDLTRSVMTQIIFDAENSGNEMLPTNFMRDIIRMYGDTMQGVLPSYLEQAMANFAQQQEQLRDSFEKAVSAGTTISGIEQLSKMNQDWINNSMRLFQSVTGGGFSSANDKSTSKSEGSGMSDNAEEIAKLKEQLNNMQDKLSKLVDE